MEILIREHIRKQINTLCGNIQLADKVYFNTGKLSPTVREIIVDKITGGDHLTKLIADIYYAYLVQSARMGEWALATIDGKGDEEFDIEKDIPENDILHIDKWKEVKELYQQLKDYNKNVFPIKGLDAYKTDPENI